MKSPFFIVQEFISPKRCEEIISKIQVNQPNFDINGDPIKLERHDAIIEDQLYAELKVFIPEIEERYSAKYKGTENMVFQYYPEFAKKPAENPGCENSKYIRKKWVKVKDVDLTGVLWLKDFNATAPIDPRIEVYGGKLEFPAYDFSLVPQAGTLVLFPAGPHFINAISPILVSDLYQVKINICIEPQEGGLWLYNPKFFPFKPGAKTAMDGWFENFI